MKNIELKLCGLLITSYMVISFIVPTDIDDYFLPGSQPLQSSTFSTPSQCANCHGGYDNAVEPAFNWRGSMMAHAMRDPLYLASLSIANQDAAEVGDLCIRCHSPVGWLEGRSIPTDGSALTSDDKEGVQCHFCHKLIDPASTDPVDLAYMSNLTHVPAQHGNGMYVVDSDNNTRRGPYSDAQANHDTKFSPFHLESALCGTCHDVSNPVFSRNPDGTYSPNSLGAAAPDFDKYELFPVERTYSEWLMSAYNSPGGIPSTAFGGNKANVSSCQDCHMPDATGYGCDKSKAPLRNDLGIHDMTGGNTFIPELIKLLGDPNVDNDAIDAGILRARYMLQNAATLNLEIAPSASGYDASVEVINETGHKLPSGYPEGRRMWINLIAKDADDNIIYESGAYDAQTATLNTSGAKVYEAKLGMTQSMADIANSNPNGHYTYSAGESFHFALNNTIVKDNRIPPRGFTNANFESIQAEPVGYAYADNSFSDITVYELPPETYEVEAKLYYQTVSKEYIEFLRDKNFSDTNGIDLYNLWLANGMSTPELMKETSMYTGGLSTANIDAVISDFTVFPNPMKSVLNLSLELRQQAHIEIAIYDLNGRKVNTMVDELMSPGTKHIEWNNTSMASGIYILKLKSNHYMAHKRLAIR
jgi:hypothetical protein